MVSEIERFSVKRSCMPSTVKVVICNSSSLLKCHMGSSLGHEASFDRSVNTSRLGFSIQFRSRKNSAHYNSAEKVLIPRNSEVYGRVNSSARNGTKLQGKSFRKSGSRKQN